MNLVADPTVDVETVASEDLYFTVDGTTISFDSTLDVVVYNMSGVVVYQGSASSIDLGVKGIYVVVCDNKPYKIAI